MRLWGAEGFASSHDEHQICRNIRPVLNTTNHYYHLDNQLSMTNLEQELFPPCETVVPHIPINFKVYSR